jgi:hypothetical protein
VAFFEDRRIKFLNGVVVLLRKFRIMLRDAFEDGACLGELLGLLGVVGMGPSTLEACNTMLRDAFEDGACLGELLGLLGVVGMGPFTLEACNSSRVISINFFHCAL